MKAQWPTASHAAAASATLTHINMTDSEVEGPGGLTCASVYYGPGISPGCGVRQRSRVFTVPAAHFPGPV